MKKNVLLILGLVLFSLNTNAQRRKVIQLPNFDKHPLHWGFYLGANQIDYQVKYKNFTNSSDVLIDTDYHIVPQTGFHVGLIGDMRLTNNLNLRLEPGLISSRSKIIFSSQNNTSALINNSETDISATYLHIPILLKISTDRINNFKPYMVAGLSYDHNFSSNEKNEQDNALGQFRMKTSNYMVELGVGVDFYFHYFKFSPSIRGIFALSNELKEDKDPESPWTSGVDFFGSQGLFLRFTFE